MKKSLLFIAAIFAFSAIISCHKEKPGTAGTTIKAVTGDATEITGSSAYVSGQAILGETVPANTWFGVLYSTSSGVLYGSATEVKATDFSSDYKYNVLISGLNSEATYYYRSYIYQNDAVTYGEVKSFSTSKSSISEGTVDLGLSVKWATCNLGATKPEEYGTYFAWADVDGQTWDGSAWSGGYFSPKFAYKLDNDNNLRPEYDAAHVHLGGSWRMPTEAEQQELIDNCTTTWRNDYNGTGVAGIIFTSKQKGYTDKSIFFPAAGSGDDCSEELNNIDCGGYYWLSTFRDDEFAYMLFFNSGDVYTAIGYRGAGFPIRPVCE